MSKTALRRILTVGTALMVATAFSPPPAHASSPNTGIVRVSSTGVLTFTAGPGATNKISAAGTLDPIFGFHDENNLVQLDPSASGSCVQATPKAVRCPGGITFATFHLGDRDDTFYVEGYTSVRVLGGAGNDTLFANFSPFNDATPSNQAALYGEEGDDILTGGDGHDLLDAGPGVNQSTNGDRGFDICRGSNVTKTSCEWS